MDRQYDDWYQRMMKLRVEVGDRLQVGDMPDIEKRMLQILLVDVVRAHDELLDLMLVEQRRTKS